MLTKLNQSLSALKDKHTEDLAELPRRNPWEEPEEFAGLQSIQEVSQQLENPNMTHIVPPTTLLRCALADFSRDHELPPTTHELFQLMEVQIPWLVTEEGLQYEVREPNLTFAAVFILGVASPLGDLAELRSFHKRGHRKTHRRTGSCPRRIEMVISSTSP